MKLKEFVSETIVQIMDGIVDAQEKVAVKGGVVNPKNITNFPEKLPYIGRFDENDKPVRLKPEELHFEIALTETTQDGKSLGLGVAIGNIGVGGNKKEGRENVSLNTVKFSVTVCFPHQE